MDDINDIVSFKSGGSEAKSEPAKVEAEATPEPKGEEATPPVARERDDAGKFKAKDEVKAEPEAKVETKVEPKVEEKPAGQLAALLAERAKRQELERQLEALKKGQTQTEKPDIFTDPEKAVAELVNQQVNPIRERFFKQSINAASKAYSDFEQAAENFSALMDANPVLVQQLRSEEDPGEFIYRIGSNTPEFREAQAAKTREELSARDTQIAALKAEIEAMKNTQQAKNDVPESLNRQPSGAIPDRDNDSDITKIVRFRSS